MAFINENKVCVFYPFGGVWPTDGSLGANVEMIIFLWQVLERLKNWDFFELRIHSAASYNLLNAANPKDLGQIWEDPTKVGKLLDFLTRLEKPPKMKIRLTAIVGEIIMLQFVLAVLDLLNPLVFGDKKDKIEVTGVTAYDSFTTKTELWVDNLQQALNFLGKDGDERLQKVREPYRAIGMSRLTLTNMLYLPLQMVEAIIIGGDTDKILKVGAPSEKPYDEITKQFLKSSKIPGNLETLYIKDQTPVPPYDPKKGHPVFSYIYPDLNERNERVLRLGLGNIKQLTTRKFVQDMMESIIQKTLDGVQRTLRKWNQKWNQKQRRSDYQFKGLIVESPNGTTQEFNLQ